MITPSPDSEFVKESGYRKIVYRSDQERSIRAMFEEAFKRSGRERIAFNPRLEQFVPEASAVGESQSNGKAENTVQRLEDMLQTYTSALEKNIDSRILTDNQIIHWMDEHSAAAYNRHVCNDDGATPYESLHGQR